MKAKAIEQASKREWVLKWMGILYIIRSTIHKRIEMWSRAARVSRVAGWLACSIVLKELSTRKTCRVSLSKRIQIAGERALRMQMLPLLTAYFVGAPTTVSVASIYGLRWMYAHSLPDFATLYATRRWNARLNVWFISIMFAFMSIRRTGHSLTRESRRTRDLNLMIDRRPACQRPKKKLPEGGKWSYWTGKRLHN